MDAAFELDNSSKNVVRKVMFKRDTTVKPRFNMDPVSPINHGRVLRVASDKTRVRCYGNGEWRVVNTGQKPGRTMISMRAPATQ